MATLLLLTSLLSALALNVSYDSRALLIDGQRKLLIAGCIHYPRSTPGMWPSLMDKAKAGGVDVIQTYVFWNLHEPVRGQYDFSGRKDIFSFFKLAQQKGLYVNLRIGPYVCAEWNFGGFPEWLHELPGVALRTDNDVYKAEMERFTRYIVNEMHSRALFADQGGPIILAQIENEYGNVQALYGEAGKRYIQWAADLALSIDQVQVPWIMCQQTGIQDPIIETCNGFYCDSFSPKSTTPKMWTENWPGWFQSWGGPFDQRPTEDIGFAVARFFAKGGSYACYYMYHGGTNFDRTAAAGLTTSYDYDVALDEYGLEHEPKYSHLGTLHQILHDFEDVITSVEPPKAESLGLSTEAHHYAYGSKCLTFLSNSNILASTVKFKGVSFKLPAWSVSLVSGCDSDLVELYNTATVSAPTRKYSMSPVPAPKLGVSMDFAGSFVEPVINGEDTREAIVQQGILDQLSVTHDTSDWAWFVTEVTGPVSSVQLCVKNVHDSVAVFVNQKFFGFSTSSSPCFSVSSSDTSVSISLLVSVMGLPNSGTLAISAGILGDVVLGKQSLKQSSWKHYSGLFGESREIFGAGNTIVWKQDPVGSVYAPGTWLKLTFPTPAGNAPLALDLGSMGKGAAWVNGNGIGRYWNITATGLCLPCSYVGTYTMFNCMTGCNEPSQKFYHVPRDWLVESGLNTLVLFDELGGDYNKVQLVERVLAETEFSLVQ